MQASVDESCFEMSVSVAAIVEVAEIDRGDDKLERRSPIHMAGRGRADRENRRLAVAERDGRERVLMHTVGADERGYGSVREHGAQAWHKPSILRHRERVSQHRARVPVQVTKPRSA